MLHIANVTLDALPRRRSPDRPVAEGGASLPTPRAVFACVAVLIVAAAGAPRALAQAPKNDAPWLRVTEDEFGIKIETDKLEAVIPKKKNKQWMTGIEKQSFLDKTSGFREIGDGLMVVYEAWCAQWPGNFLVMIVEVHGRPVKAGESFSAAHIVGYFATTDDMHAVYDRYRGHTALRADAAGWRLEKTPAPGSATPR